MRKATAISILILVTATIESCSYVWVHAECASSNFILRVRFPSFLPYSWILNDYILAVELEIPSMSFYDEKRTDCSRYTSQIPPLEFSIDDSWIGLDAKITIFARWHLDDVLIDINPNSADGRWGPFYKQASALVLSYVIGAPSMQGSADGKNDGYLLDYPHDAYISYVIETPVVPEFPTWIPWFAAIGLSTLAVALVSKKHKCHLHKPASTSNSSTLIPINTTSLKSQV
jgi:hypothetical protein